MSRPVFTPRDRWLAVASLVVRALCAAGLRGDACPLGALIAPVAITGTVLLLFGTLDSALWPQKHCVPCQCRGAAARRGALAGALLGLRRPRCRRRLGRSSFSRTPGSRDELSRSLSSMTGLTAESAASAHRFRKESKKRKQTKKATR